MRRVNRYIIFLDNFAMVVAFLFFVWLRPASRRLYLMQNYIPFLVYLGFSLILSVYFGKYNASGKSKYFDFIIPIIKTNIFTIGFVTIIIFSFSFSISRLVVIGTPLLATFFQVFIFSVSYYLESLKFEAPLHEEPGSTVFSDENFTAQLTEIAKADEEVEIVREIKLDINAELTHRGEFNKKLIIDDFSEKVYLFLTRFIDFNNSKNIFLATTTLFNLEKIDRQNCKNIINLDKINNCRRINKIFETTNIKLPKNGLFIGCVETKEIRKKRILNTDPPIIAQLHYFFDYLIKRVWPKLPLFKKVYFFMTKGQNRVISKAETIGRLFSCGFRIIADSTINELLYFVAEKISEPAYDYHASYGPIFKMRRIGKDGNEINVFKLRTMYPYSEYIQEYLYGRSKLKEGGKLNRDFRITTIGRLFRRFWIDEIPMLYNWLKGDLKLVGVRPLSKHYLSLYTKELQDKRKKFKPGLVPPFYADMPKTLEEIMASEMRYIDAYEKRPFITDIRYFFKAWNNIIFKHARSR